LVHFQHHRGLLYSCACTHVPRRNMISSSILLVLLGILSVTRAISMCNGGCSINGVSGFCWDSTCSNMNTNCVCSSGKPCTTNSDCFESPPGYVGSTVLSFTPPSTPAGQTRCVIGPSAASADAKASVLFSIDATQADTYSIDFGSVPSGTAQGSCSGFSASNPTFGEMCDGNLCSNGFFRDADVGRPMAVRIFCQNSVQACDFEAGSSVRMTVLFPPMTTSTNALTTTAQTGTTSGSSGPASTTAPTSAPSSSAPCFSPRHHHYLQGPRAHLGDVAAAPGVRDSAPSDVTGRPHRNLVLQR